MEWMNEWKKKENIGYRKISHRKERKTVQEREKNGLGNTGWKHCKEKRSHG